MKRIFVCMALCLFPADLALGGNDNIHRDISKCFQGNYEGDCSSVCAVCHINSIPGSGERTLEKLPSQEWNPSLVRVDEAYPGLNTESENPWLNLPEEHQSCRGCHEDITNKRGNHPTGIKYESNGTMKGLKDKPKGVMLFGGTIECSTCHAPHSNVRALLRVTDAKAALCLSCHIK